MQMRDYTYTPYNAVVTSAFTQNINQLPALREELETAFSTGFARFEQAFIGSAEMRSASVFSVQFNRETTMTAVLLPSGQFGLEYYGPIDRIVFLGDSTVTLTWFRIGWNAGKLEHKVVEFDAPDGTTFVLKDSVGAVIQPCDTMQYELYIDQVCTYTATNTDYNTLTDIPVTYHWEDTITVPMVTKTYTITFATTPSAATIVVKDAEDATVAPTSNPKVYVLTDSSIAGNYSYTVSADGYDDGTGTIDAQEDATETVVLDVSTWQAVISVTPVTATFELTDAEGTPITPDSTSPAGTYTYDALEDSRAVGDYLYSASADGYTQIVDESLSVTEATTESVDMEVLTWEYVMAVTPVDATFVLLDSESNPITPDGTTPEGTYTFNALEDSRVVGDYEWSASKTNYVTQTDTYSAVADDSEAITLVLELVSVAVTTPPTKTVYSVGEYFDPAGAVVTATFADLSTADVTSIVTWTPTETLTALDTAATASYLYHGVTETDDTPISVS